MSSNTNMRAGGVSRDFATILADLNRLRPQVTPEWTYDGSDDLGIALLELVAYEADHLHYRGDTIIRDLSMLSTVYRSIAVQRAQWLGYWVKRRSPSTTTLDLTIAPALGFDQPLPSGMVFSGQRDGQTVLFETVRDYTLPAGDTTISVDVVEGTTQNSQLLGTATGRAFERFSLPTGTIFNQSNSDLEITIGSNTASLVRAQIDANSSDLVYWVREARDGSLNVLFGDGINGSLLSVGHEVRCTYRLGGGRVGRIEGGGIDTQASAISDLTGVPISFTVVQPNSASGGLERESLSSIQQNAPANYKTQDRLVTMQDYETEALQSPYVHRVSGAHVGVNGVRLYVVVNGADSGNVLTPLIVQDLTNRIDPKRMATDVLSFAEASLVPIDITFKVQAFPGASNNVVEKAIQKLINNPAAGSGLLSFEGGQLSEDLALSDFIGLVELVDGVNYLQATQFQRRAGFHFLTASGNATYNEALTAIGATAQTEIFNISFLNALTYRVKGSVSGLQNNLGTLGALFTTDSGGVSFQLDAGLIPMSQGDYGELRVGEVLSWRIDLGGREFPVAGLVTINVTGGIDQ